MKNFFITALIFCIPLQAVAFEDYIILSDVKVEAIFVKNQDIVSIQPIFTIDNNKNTLFLRANKVGKTTAIIDTENGERIIDIKVSADKTEISNTNDMYYFIMDEANGRNN